MQAKVFGEKLDPCPNPLRFYSAWTSLTADPASVIYCPEKSQSIKIR